MVHAHSRRPHRFTAGGFTLIELLVVIGIISVLVAILLPALNKARQAAKSVQCLSQQRQIAMAEFMYANDNGGYLLPIDMGLNAGDGLWYTNLLVDGGYIPDGKWNDRSWGSLVSGIFHCPSLDDPGWYGGIGLSVSVSNFNGRSARLSSVKSPGRIALLADAPAKGYDAMPYIFNSHGGLWNGNWHVSRHNGGGNVTFCDGHGEHWFENELLNNKEGILNEAY